MKMRSNLLLLFVVAFVAPASSAAPTPLRPHVVSLLIDDLGFYDTSVQNPNASTPAITELVNEGIKLQRHYVRDTQQPVMLGSLIFTCP